MSPGTGNNDLQLAVERVKAQDKSNIAMNQYQQDLLDWSKNVDKRYAWVVLAALWFMMTATLGPYRIYSLVFAKVTEDKIYTREEASWPVSAIFTVENIAGPFVSIIAYHISFRKSLLVGSILLTLGNGLSAISNSLWLDVVLLGFVQGIGFAFIFMPFMEIINNYFLRYRNMALGIALCGGTVSIFAWSPIFNWLLEKFYWRYSYLGICAVCSINLLMVPFLKPNPMPKFPSNAPTKPIKLNTNASLSKKLSRNSVRALTYQNSIRRQSTILVARRSDCARLKRQSSIISVNPFATSVGIERKVSRAISRAEGNPTDKVDKTNKQDNFSQQITEKEYFETLSLNDIGKDSDFEMSIIWEVLKTPAFHLIWYNELVYFWLFSIYCLVLVDYGTDQGCSLDEAQSLLNFQSIGELIGRLGLTVLVDLRLTSNKNSTVLVLFILAALLVVVTQINGFIWMATLTTLISAFSALLYILLNGLLVDSLGEQQVTLGYGMASFIGGVLMSFRPQAVGYFRDRHGTYDPLMICLAIASALGGILWVIEPLLNRLVSKCSRNKENIDDESRA